MLRTRGTKGKKEAITKKEWESDERKGKDKEGKVKKKEMLGKNRRKIRIRRKK